MFFFAKENLSLKTFFIDTYDDQNFKIPLSLLTNGKGLQDSDIYITAIYTFSPFGVNWISGLEFERDDIFILGGAIEFFFLAF